MHLKLTDQEYGLKCSIKTHKAQSMYESLIVTVPTFKYSINEIILRTYDINNPSVLYWFAV